MVKTVDVLGFPHTYELSAPTDRLTDTPPVLVFVHGWLLSRAYWQPVIEQLAENYPCLSYDLRGFGESRGFGDSQSAPERAADALPQAGSQHVPETVSETVMQKTAVSVASPASTAIDFPELPARTTPAVPISPTDPTAAAPAENVLSRYTPAAYAQDLVNLLAELQIQKAWVVGHSLGGSIALWAAHLAPETIEGVICVNAGGGIYLKEEFERFRLAGEQLVKFRPRWLSYVPLLDLLMTRMNVHRPIARHWGKQRLKDLLTADAEAALRSLLDSTTEAEVHQLPQVVAQLQQPVHFIAGQKDTVMEPQYVRHLASFHPSFDYCGHNVSELEACGHLAMIEQTDATVAEIRAILGKHAA